MKRIGTWRVPPNYSARDWREEMRAHGTSAAWQAVCEYDPTCGVVFSAFVHQRVIGSALTRYRQEWAYARRCVSQAEEVRSGSRAVDASFSGVVQESLRYVLAGLSNRDRWLLEQLFFEERTEGEVAPMLPVSQPTVSKRKQALLHSLREWLEIEKIKI